MTVEFFLQEAEEEKNNPAFIPRRDAFWGHDDRWTDTPDDERSIVLCLMTLFIVLIYLLQSCDSVSLYLTSTLMVVFLRSWFEAFFPFNFVF